ncbi:hypothetical protein J7M28_03635 [bacterium]|nr:hypothetical protein [bacterium]
MDTRVIESTPCYQVNGAVGYIRNEQRLPAMGMGLVAQLGGHKAAFYVGLGEKPATPDSTNFKAGKSVDDMMRTEPLRLSGMSYSDPTKAASALYDCAGQLLDELTTGKNVDLRI